MFYNKTKEFQKRYKKINMERYGVKYPTQNKFIFEKAHDRIESKPFRY